MHIERIEEWRGQAVVDSDGEKVGKLEEVLFDGQDARLGCVGTGLFGRKLSLVPLEQATLGREHVRVPFSRETIKDAPTMEPDTPVNARLEAAVFEHYGGAAPDRGDSGVTYESSGTRERRAEEQRLARERATELEEAAARAAEDAEKARARAEEAEREAKELGERRDRARAEVAESTEASSGPDPAA